MIPAGIAIASLALATASSADRVADGKTVLKLDDDTFQGFAEQGIGLKTTGAAKDNKNGYVFPMEGGRVNTGPKGEIEHRGGLKFFALNGISVKASKFTARIGKRNVRVYAKSRQSEMRFLDLDLSDARIGGSLGANLRIEGEATLAKQAAEVLSDSFEMSFPKGADIGVLNIKALMSPQACNRIAERQGAAPPPC